MPPRRPSSHDDGRRIRRLDATGCSRHSVGGHSEAPVLLDLNDFHLFVHVVDRGGFTAAARALALPKSTISHRIRQLEDALGARLLSRTSRQLSVTDAGADFYRHAVAMLRQAEAAETAVRQRLVEPSGTIRFTAAIATMQFALGGVLERFALAYPKVRIFQHVTDANVDLIAGNFDIAVRAHNEPLPDSTLVQRTLASTPWHLFAGRGYLDRAGTPQTPEALAGHDSLFMVRQGVAYAWTLRHPNGGAHALKLEPRFMSDCMVGLKRAAQVGLGIVALPGFICRDEVRSGALVRVLPEWVAADATLTALMPHKQALLPAVRALMDFLVAEVPPATTL